MNSIQICDDQRIALIAYGDARANGDSDAIATAFVNALHTMPDTSLLLAEVAAYKWAYEYLQNRMVSIGREGWANDCNSEIEARIQTKKASTHSYDRRID